MSVKYHFSGEISEEEIQKAIADYKKSIKLGKYLLSDREIRDFCIKSLVRKDVNNRSYVNPENK